MTAPGSSRRAWELTIPAVRTGRGLGGPCAAHPCGQPTHRLGIVTAQVPTSTASLGCLLSWSRGDRGVRRVQGFAAPGHTFGGAAYRVDGALSVGGIAAALSAGNGIGAPPAFSDTSAQNHASLGALAESICGSRRHTWRLALPGHSGALKGLSPLLASKAGDSCRLAALSARLGQWISGSVASRWLLRGIATLLQQGAEPVRGAILPTGEYSPDRFDGSPRSVGDLLSRIQNHAGLADLRVKLSIVTPDGEVENARCGTSVDACCGGVGALEAKFSRVARKDDGSYTVLVPTVDVRNPTVLTTGLVRAVTFMFMTEADAYRGVLDTDREALTDLAGVLLGFGVLLANGSYLYAKGCHGVSVQSATRMPVDEITLALAVFGKLFDVSARSMSRHLEPTPAEHFDEAEAWARSNAGLLRLLRSRPHSIADRPFSVAPVRSFLARVLGVGSKTRAVQSDDELAQFEHAVQSATATPRPKLDAAKAAKLAELRALVDESLQG